MGTMGLGPMGIGWLLPLVLLALLIYFIYIASDHGTASGRALDILDERYAKGEISEAEYEAKRAKILEGE